jgi:hypothetical protein
VTDRANRVYLDRVLGRGEAVDEAVRLLRDAGAEVGRDPGGRWFTSRRDPRVMAWLAFVAGEQAAAARYGG